MRHESPGSSDNMHDVLKLMKGSPDAHVENNGELKGIQESNIVSFAIRVLWGGGGGGIVKMSSTSTLQQVETSLNNLI